MKSYEDRQIDDCIHKLDDPDPEVRIRAIDLLGDIGDELCLKELRERLRKMTNEHQALIIAVGKLKRSQGIR